MSSYRDAAGPFPNREMNAHWRNRQRLVKIREVIEQWRGGRVTHATVLETIEAVLSERDFDPWLAQGIDVVLGVEGEVEG